MSIVTLMSSNENPSLTNFTPATSYASGLSSLASTNQTLLTTLFSPSKRSWNLPVIIGCCSAAVLFLILLIYAVIKYRNRVEGSYKIDESQNFLSKTHPDQHDQSGKLFSSHNHRHKSSNNNNEQNGLDPKEWYV